MINRWLIEVDGVSYEVTPILRWFIDKNSRERCLKQLCINTQSNQEIWREISTVEE